MVVCVTCSMNNVLQACQHAHASSSVCLLTSKSELSITLFKKPLNGCVVLQVPLWDALNHVTGRCNVRLHHSEKRAVLQMILTQPVKQGEELINNYGPLSDSELLRRFGFTEDQPNPHNNCEVPFGMVQASCQQQISKTCKGNTSSHAVPSSSVEALLQQKLKFIRKHALIPADGWFKVDLQGNPPCELIEVVRLFMLSAADFNVFARQVHKWHCPLVRPLSQLTQVSSFLVHVLENVVSSRLSKLTLPVVASSDMPQQASAKAVVRLEHQLLSNFRAWLQSVDEAALIDLCKEVWTHAR